MKKIKQANPKIHVVTHLIFGLPDESDDDMMKSVDFVSKTNFLESSGGFFEQAFGIKITSLYILRRTKLSEMYEKGEYEPLSKEKYFGLLEKALPRLGENAVVHRLTGDPPKSLLIAPEWPKDKKRVMNEIKEIVNAVSRKN